MQDNFSLCSAEETQSWNQIRRKVKGRFEFYSRVNIRKLSRICSTKGGLI